MLVESILASVAAWLSTSAVFIGIPVVCSLRADVRAAQASGLPRARNVARARFFFPSRGRALHATLLNKVSWVERYTTPVHEKRALRVTAVRAHSLQLEDGSIFEPRSMSRGFADGSGAAKGIVRDTHGSVPALIVFP
jgi:hypothetical protein